MDDLSLIYMRAELSKSASAINNLLSNPRLHGSLGLGGALGGIGAVGGALAGAGVKGVQAYRDAKEQGAGTGGAALHSLMGAAGGAQRGAMIGGAAGFGAGALAGAVRPGQASALRGRLSEMAGIGGAARFGQRQVHAVSGWRPDQADASSIRQLGIGAHGAEQRLKGAVEHANFLHHALDQRAGRAGQLQDLIKKDPSLVGKLQSLGGQSEGQLRLDWLKAQREVRSARDGYDSAYRAEHRGLSSIPGLVQYASTNPGGAVDTLRNGFKEQWNSMSPGWKAMMIGAPLAEAGVAAMSPEQEGQPGKGARIGSSLANAAVGATMGAIPMTTANLLINPVASGAGKLIGAGVDRLRSRHAPAPLPAGAPTHNTVPETSGRILPEEAHQGQGV